MALQGSIDSFPMVDVLRLLGSTKKSGRLALRGDRGTANLWLVDGEVVGGDASSTAASAPGPEVVDVVFEMMRFGTGDFEFLSEQLHADPRPSREVESLIAESVDLMEEWLEIAESLPSMDQTIEMRTGIDEDVVLTPDMWRAVCCIGSGVSVRELIQIGGWGELPTLRVCRDLLEQDLIAISDGDTYSPSSGLGGAPEPTSSSTESAPAPLFESFTHDPLKAGSSSVFHSPEPYSADPLTEFESSSDIFDRPGEQSGASHPASGGGAFAASGSEGSEDWTQHLASLSPEVARAVAEAASETDEERARVLKFLGSV